MINNNKIQPVMMSELNVPVQGKFVPKIKVCGVTNVADAEMLKAFNVDAIGLSFVPGSARLITKETAKEIVSAVGKDFVVVGLFPSQDEERIADIINTVDIDVVQISDEKQTEFCSSYTGPVIKAKRDADSPTLKVMVDFHVSFGGYHIYSEELKYLDYFLGDQFAVEASRFGIVVLSGGVEIESLHDAITRVKPYYIDVCECVESTPGKLSQPKVAQFFQALLSE